MEPFPAVANGGENDHHDGDGTRHTVTTIKSGHSANTKELRRSHSGSIFSRIGFSRPQAAEERTSKPSPSGISNLEHDDFAESDAQTPLPGIAAVQSQGRKRKGSLRKTALLGTGFLKMDRRSSDPSRKSASPKKASSKSSLDPSTTGSSIDSGVASDRDQVIVNAITPSISTSPVTSPTGTVASATDDDEGLVLPILAKESASLQHDKSPSVSPSPPSSESSGPVPGHAIRRHSSTNTKSPLASPQQTELSTVEEDWDYSDTEWWGWVVLVVTWIVFVVGMGSCLEVWSWAWDVGETPYAPPELEDDPTLPIVGYYPALIILTAVMSWVWCVVSWVGMKYFKHAKIQADDM